MRRTANADLAAFHKIDARVAGLDAYFAAAVQDRFHLALDNFDARGSGDGDSFAINNSHRVGSRLVGARSGHGDQRSTQNSATRHRNRRAAQARDQIGEGRHSMILRATEAESLAY